MLAAHTHSHPVSDIGQFCNSCSLKMFMALRRVVQYALQRHLPAGSTVSSHAGCLDSLLQSKHAEANAQIQASRYGTYNLTPFFRPQP